MTAENPFQPDLIHHKLYTADHRTYHYYFDKEGKIQLIRTPEINKFVFYTYHEIDDQDNDVCGKPNTLLVESIFKFVHFKGMWTLTRPTHQRGFLPIEPIPLIDFTPTFDIVGNNIGDPNPYLPNDYFKIHYEYVPGEKRSSGKYIPRGTVKCKGKNREPIAFSHNFTYHEHLRLKLCLPSLDPPDFPYVDKVIPQ